MARTNPSERGRAMKERSTIPALFMAACAILAIAGRRPRGPPASTTRSSSLRSASCRTSSTARRSCSRARSAAAGTSASSSTSPRRSRSASSSRHTSPRKVADPVFLGGPVSPEVIFALVQGKSSPGGRSIRILDDLPRDRLRRRRPRHRKTVFARASSPAWCCGVPASFRTK